MNFLKSHLKSLIVIPTYNNAPFIEKVITSVQEAVPQIPLLVIDDGCDDGSADILKKLDVHVIKHSVNRGKGAALRSGYAYALEHGFNGMITMDSDGQHLATDILSIYEAASQNPESLIIGSRDFTSQESGEVPFSSRFGRVFSNFWIFMETGKWLADTQSGFRYYPVRSELFELCYKDHYDFEIEIITKAIWAGLECQCVPISVRYPQDRISHFDAWRDNWRLTKVHSALFFLNIIRFLLPKTQGEVRGMKFLESFAYVLPKSFAYITAIVPVSYIFLMHSEKRRALQDFYTRIHKPLSFIGPFRNFWYFSASLIDRTYAISRQLVPSIQIVQSITHIKPGIFIGSHYGDWLLAAQCLSQQDYGPIAIVMRGDISPKFQKLLQRLESDNLKVFDMSHEGPEAVLAMKDHVDQGGHLCFMIDRFLYAKRYYQVHEFFNSPCYWLSAPFRIASLLKVPLYTFNCLKISGWPSGGYQLNIMNIWDAQDDMNKDQLLKAYLQNLEDQVYKHPQHWFNFFSFWDTYNDDESRT